jgi:hypothetical protein
MTLDQFHDQGGCWQAVDASVLDTVQVRDVRVIEGGENERFSFEASESCGIVRNSRGKHLDRDVTLQSRVARAVHFAHTAGVDRGKDFASAALIVDSPSLLLMQNWTPR